MAVGSARGIKSDRFKLADQPGSGPGSASPAGNDAPKLFFHRNAWYARWPVIIELRKTIRKKMKEKMTAEIIREGADTGICEEEFVEILEEIEIEDLAVDGICGVY